VVTNAKEVLYNNMEPEDAEYWDDKLLPNSGGIGHRDEDIHICRLEGHTGVVCGVQQRHGNFTNRSGLERIVNMMYEAM
jgi:hypothetical protein